MEIELEGVRVGKNDAGREGVDDALAKARLCRLLVEHGEIDAVKGRGRPKLPLLEELVVQDVVSADEAAEEHWVTCQVRVGFKSNTWNIC